MSKLARNPIDVPEKVTVTVDGQTVTAKGPKGEMSFTAHNDVSVIMGDGEKGKTVAVEPRSKSLQARALWGTTWALIRNAVTGVEKGFQRDLEIQGVGYRANMQGNKLVMQLGFSHDVEYPIPEGIDIKVEKQTQITVSGIDKQQVGQIASEIRSYRPPEPYKGKGVRYKDEYVLRKEGKKK